MVASISNDYVTLRVKGNAALTLQLARTAALSAQITHICAIVQAKHLDAAVDVSVMHEHVTAAVDCDAAWLVELIPCAAFAADGSDVGTICIA